MKLISRYSRSMKNLFALTITVIILIVSGHVMAGWSAMESGTEDFLMDVWGTSEANVYVVGFPILHYDGSTWLQVDGGATGVVHYDIWGSSQSDIFTVGWDAPPSNGFFRYYDVSED